MIVNEKIKAILLMAGCIVCGIWVSIADGGIIPVLVTVIMTPILLALIVLTIRADGESDGSEAASTSTTPAPAKATPAPAADTWQADATVAKNDAGGSVPVPTTQVPVKAAPAPAADTRKATSKTNFEMGTVMETGPLSTVYKLIKYHGHDETVTVPDGVKYIEKMAFTKDVKYTSRFVPPAGHFYGEGLTREEEYRVAAGTWETTVCGGEGLPFLRKVILPESVKYIGDYAFCFCKNLEDINLPFGMQRIGKHAFHGCTSLKRIEVPVGTTIEDGAFEDTHTQVVHVTKKQATISTQTTSKASDNLRKEGNILANPPADKPSAKQPAPATNDRMPISLDDLEQMFDPEVANMSELCLCRGKDVPVDRRLGLSPLFHVCISLKKLDLSYFHLTYMWDTGFQKMLIKCTQLEEVILSDTILECEVRMNTCDKTTVAFGSLTGEEQRKLLGLVDGAKLTIVPHRMLPGQEVKPPQPTFYSSSSARQQNDETSRGPRDVPSMMKSLEQEYMGDDWEENLRRELRY